MPEFFLELTLNNLKIVFSAGFNLACEITQGEVVAIDGKTLRHSYDKEAELAAVHMVSAWATTNRLVLGQEFL